MTPDLEAWKKAWKDLATIVDKLKHMSQRQWQAKAGRSSSYIPNMVKNVPKDPRFAEMHAILRATGLSSQQLAIPLRPVMMPTIAMALALLDVKEPDLEDFNQAVDKFLGFIGDSEN